MGTDIHIYFEKKVKNHWELVWQPILYPDYWWEYLAIMDSDEPLKAAMALESIGCDTIEEMNQKYGEKFDSSYSGSKEYCALVLYYKNMDVDEAERLFLYHPHAIRKWPYPKLHIKHISSIDNFLLRSEIEERNYDFFYFLCGVRGDGFPGVAIDENNHLRGLPNDIHELIQCESDYLDIDGHSHSWIMVNELLTAIETYYPKLYTQQAEETIQYKWLKTFIGDPENTRMVFWFDN